MIGKKKTKEELIQNDGLFSLVIGSFPCPIAIFERSGTIIMANRALMEKASIKPEDVKGRRIHFLNRITNENADVLEASEDTFLGGTTLLKNLVEPLYLFSMDNIIPDHSDGYQSAVFFPVYQREGKISYGAVMLMK